MLEIFFLFSLVLSSSVQTLTKGTFDAVVGQSFPALVLFRPSHHYYDGLLTELSTLYPTEVIFATVFVNNEKELAERFELTRMFQESKYAVAFKVPLNLK